jgi:hypothetical protein
MTGTLEEDSSEQKLNINTHGVRQKVCAAEHQTRFEVREVEGVGSRNTHLVAVVDDPI